MIKNCLSLIEPRFVNASTLNASRSHISKNKSMVWYGTSRTSKMVHRKHVGAAHISLGALTFTLSSQTDPSLDLGKIETR